MELVQDAIAHSSPATKIRHFASTDTAAPPDDATRALLATGDAILTGYASSDDDARMRVEAVKALGKTDETWGMIRALAPDMTDPEQIRPRIEAWRAAGVDGIDVYNYGLMTKPMFDAVATALAPLKGHHVRGIMSRNLLERKKFPRRTIRETIVSR